MQYLYIIKCQQFYKIGIAQDVKDRVKTLQTGNPYPLEVVAHYSINGKAPRLEGIMHKALKNKKSIGEWFELNNTELSLLKETCEFFSRESVTEIKSMVEKWINYRNGGLAESEKE